MAQPMKCKYCGRHCYGIEVSDEGAGWRDKDGNPCHYPEWEDTFRLQRTCGGMVIGEKDEHRTDWTRSMKDAVAQWNELN